MREGVRGVGKVATDVSATRDRFQGRPHDSVGAENAGNGVTLAASIGLYRGLSAICGSGCAGGYRAALLAAGNQSAAATMRQIAILSLPGDARACPILPLRARRPVEATCAVLPE